MPSGKEVLGKGSKNDLDNATLRKMVENMEQRAREGEATLHEVGKRVITALQESGSTEPSGDK